jgi:hypothetical protein
MTLNQASRQALGSDNALHTFNPQISQITQIIMNVLWRFRNLPRLISRSLLREDRDHHLLIHRGLPRGNSLSY